MHVRVLLQTRRYRRTMGSLEILRNGQFSAWLRYLNSESLTRVISRIDTDCSLRDFVAISIAISESG